MAIDRIGLSGIRAANISLSNTAHNIANSETPWFTRMQPVLVTEQGHRADYLRQPGGVSVQQLMRLSSEFLNNQVFQARSDQGQADTIATTLNTIDKLFSGEHTGMTDVINDFIGDLKRIETKPESLPLRDQWLGSARRLVTRLHSLDHQLNTLLSHRNEQMATVITEINRITESITKLNRQIVAVSGAHINEHNRSSGLQDQRDKLTNDLATLIGVDVLNSDNSLTLSIRSAKGNIPLVIGEKHWPLAIKRPPADTLPPRVSLQANGIEIPVLALSGKLAGLQQLAGTDEQGLVSILNELGWQAVLLAESINQQLQKGDDLTGSAAVPLFNDINSSPAMARRVLPIEALGDEKLTVAIRKLPELKPSDYRLVFTAIEPDGNRYQLTRLSDGHQVTGKIGDKGTLSIDGLTVQLEGTPATNDRFLLTPWRQELRHLEVILHDPQALGFAKRSQGPGDNRNLQSLLDTISGKKSANIHIQDYYVRLQSTIANYTAAALEKQSTTETIYNSSLDERESLSGVNMDDEAANLIRLHQFYQANARLLQVNRAIIDDLLAMF